MVRAVRGATTVEENTSTQIISATKELLTKIINKNNIKNDDMISIIFTVTNDLNATFPAKAARELGILDVALMDATEINVPGSLSKCIRILLTFNTNSKNNKDIKNVYLKKAVNLRPDITGGK